MGNFNFKSKHILYYYVFQKQIYKYLKDWNSMNDSYSISNGYFINPEWIEDWKRRINYNSIKTSYLDHFNIDSLNLNQEQILLIKQHLDSNIVDFNQDFTCLVKNTDFSAINENFITLDYLQNFVDQETFTELNINGKTKIEYVEYIFKKKMLFLFFQFNSTIKIILYDEKTQKLRNIKYIANFPNCYYFYRDLIAKQNSDQILQYFNSIQILNKPRFVDNRQSPPRFMFINIDEEYAHLNASSQNKEIKNPKEINFNLATLPSFRGLDNVGATCYMNATLQCLANIKPITDYLLNPTRYFYLYENMGMCNLTLKYVQVLIGLFCNESRTGSYRPEDFKKTISEYNPLFEGVKANDSKDLIIFLLEILNKELNNIHHKKHNSKGNENETYPKIDVSNENEVLKVFVDDYNKHYSSVIGNNLCGFQKSIITCQYCHKPAYNFNIFNLLIFSLEATSNYFNLSHNNTMIPVINFAHCFKFLAKEESFNNTYCQKCGKTGNSKYQEIIYSMPFYLIIILNRGKGNIFNCKVDIPKQFDISDLIPSEKNNIFKLIGIVSHFGESNMGGHFIAFCRHRINKKWYCYNDSTVTESQNDFLEKGTPYILFYRKEEIKNNNNPQANINNQINDYNKNNNNKPMNLNNNINQNQQNMINFNQLNINSNTPQNMINNNPQNMINNNPQNMINNNQLNINSNIQQNMINNNPQNMINKNSENMINNNQLNMNSNLPQNMINNFPQNMINNRQINMNSNLPQNMINNNQLNMNSNIPQNMNINNNNFYPNMKNMFSNFNNIPPNMNYKKSY